jgi:hypothetical protein
MAKLTLDKRSDKVTVSLIKRTVAPLTLFGIDASVCLRQNNPLHLAQYFNITQQLTK